MQRRVPVDAVWVLTVFLVLRIFLPSVLTIGALGGAGHPASVFGLGCLAWWAFYHLQRGPVAHLRVHHVRRASAVFACACLASYVAAMTRPLDPSEKTVADLSMLQVASWLGVLLLASDGVLTKDRLLVLLRRLVAMVAIIAALGIVQFFTKEVFVDRIRIPGLTLSNPLDNLAERGGFSRAVGTALHAIEYGAVLTLVLPIALAMAFSDTKRGLARRWIPCGLIVVATTLCISRSALLGLAVGLLVLLPALSRQARWGVVCAGGAFGVIVFLTVPGLSGTILGLFTGVGNDSSVQSRTGSYPLAWEFIKQAPIFGRGLGTFLPKYRILDNEYLLLLIEVGFAGLIAMLALLVTGIGTAWRTARAEPVGDPWRMVGRGAAAGVAAGSIELAFFDGFSFPMFTGLLFALLGVIGAHARLVRTERLGAAAASATHGSMTP